MDAILNTTLSIAPLAVSAVALFFSLVAAYPGLKWVIAAVRDGVLWFALFLILSASAFVVWQHLEKSRETSHTASSAAEARATTPFGEDEVSTGERGVLAP